MQIESLQPLHNRVLVRRHDPETHSKGGIILTGNAVEDANQGVVLAVGPGKVLLNGQVRAPSISIGDRIAFGPFSAQSVVKVGSEELLLMTEDEVYGVLEESA